MSDSPHPEQETQLRLLGAWHLSRWEICYGDGRPSTFPFGRDATGMILYTSDGFMSACIAMGDRPELGSASVRSAPEAEQIAAFGSYFQYAGRFKLQSAAGSPSGWQVVHQVTHSLNPNFVGTDQVRNLNWAGEGLLTLSASDTVPGSDIARHHALQWRRA
jgi:hypothetical protein